MIEPERLPQEIIPTGPEPGPPAVESDWPAWESALKTLEAARACDQIIPIPPRLEDLACAASAAHREGRPLPGMAPVRRELARLRERLVRGARTCVHSRWRIAEGLGLTQPAVCRILRRVGRRMLARMEVDVRAVRAMQHFQLE